VKILFGAGVADGRASLGGHTFSKNRNGAYIRQKVSPSQPRSARQLAVRASFAGLSKAWGSVLTDLQRAGWIALASTVTIPDRFGNPQVPTGLQLYMRVNQNLFTLATARLDDAPADQGVSALTSAVLTATFTGSILTLAFTPTPLGANEHIVIAATPPFSPGKQFVTSFLKQTFADPAGASATPTDIYAPWNALFGALQPGQKVAVSAFVVNDINGAASAPASAVAITGA